MNSLDESNAISDCCLFRILQLSMLTFHKILGMIFHLVFNSQLLGNSLIWIHLFKRSMFMFEVVSLFQCKFQVLILFLVVEIHSSYLLLYHHRVVQAEIYFGMMVIRLVCLNLPLFID